jgi:HicB-like protein involved in pilus formation
MDLTPYVDTVRRELAVAAETGGEDAIALAERLTAPLAATIRLTLLDALSAAADEITSELAPGSIEVRLRAGEPTFVISLPVGEEAREESQHDNAEPDETPVADDGAMARINVRLPENLKTRIEEAAAAQGRSVNAWFVRAASTALRPTETATAPSSSRSSRSRSAQSFTGWVS